MEHNYSEQDRTRDAIRVIKQNGDCTGVSIRWCHEGCPAEFGNFACGGTDDLAHHIAACTAYLASQGLNPEGYPLAADSTIKSATKGKQVGFSIGDRVELLERSGPWDKGSKGTVVSAGAVWQGKTKIESPGIRFDDKHPGIGHDCAGACEDGYGRWVITKKLTRISREDPAPGAKPIPFSVGDLSANKMMIDHGVDDRDETRARRVVIHHPFEVMVTDDTPSSYVRQGLGKTPSRVPNPKRPLLPLPEPVRSNPGIPDTMVRTINLGRGMR